MKSMFLAASLLIGTMLKAQTKAELVSWLKKKVVVFADTLTSPGDLFIEAPPNKMFWSLKKDSIVYNFHEICRNKNTPCHSLTSSISINDIVEVSKFEGVNPRIYISTFGRKVRKESKNLTENGKYIPLTIEYKESIEIKLKWGLEKNLFNNLYEALIKLASYNKENNTPVIITKNMKPLNGIFLSSFNSNNDRRLRSESINFKATDSFYFAGQYGIRFQYGRGVYKIQNNKLYLEFDNTAIDRLPDTSGNINVTVQKKINDVNTIKIVSLDFNGIPLRHTNIQLRKAGVDSSFYTDSLGQKTFTLKNSEFPLEIKILSIGFKNNVIKLDHPNSYSIQVANKSVIGAADILNEGQKKVYEISKIGDNFIEMMPIEGDTIRNYQKVNVNDKKIKIGL